MFFALTEDRLVAELLTLPCTNHKQLTKTAWLNLVFQYKLNVKSSRNLIVNVRKK